jgi:hypothetical protein
MPLGALPTSATHRTVCHYVFESSEYTVQYRWRTGTTESGMVSTLNDYHDYIRNHFWQSWAVLSVAEYYAVNDTFSTEITITPLTTGSTSTQPSTVPDALQYEVLGRSPDSRRVKWHHQGCIAVMDAQQRLTQGMDTHADALLSAFNTLVASGVCTISGQSPIIKPYVNLVVNDYLTRKARRG